ncbi:unnamed protein product [Jaminaea pallidilutea]
MTAASHSSLLASTKIEGAVRGRLPQDEGRQCKGLIVASWECVSFVRHKCFLLEEHGPVGFHAGPGSALEAECMRPLVGFMGIRKCSSEGVDRDVSPVVGRGDAGSTLMLSYVLLLSGKKTRRKPAGRSSSKGRGFASADVFFSYVVPTAEALRTSHASTPFSQSHKQDRHLQYESEEALLSVAQPIPT